MNRSTRLLLLFLVMSGVLLAMPVIGRADAENAAEGAAARGVARAVAETGGHEEGTPTLIKAPKEAMITALTTIIVFVLLIVVLGKFAWGPIVKGLEAREQKIRTDIEEAEKARRTAEETLKQYNDKLAQIQSQVQATLAQATQQAERIAANIKEQAGKDAEETKSRAVKDIESARDQAIQEVYTQAADLATNVAGKILRRNLNSQDQQDLVNESLQQLQGIGSRA